MYCTNCGKKIPEKAVVCTHCGVAVLKEKPKANKGMDSMQAIIIGAILFGVTVFSNILGYAGGIAFIVIEGCGLGMLVGGLVKLLADKIYK